jgi:membrane protease YdiL (CAAX protease family)
METGQERAANPVPPFRKILEAFLMLLFFEGSQGMTLLGLPRHLLGVRRLDDHPWINVYEGHIWELAFALAFIGISSGPLSQWGLTTRNARLSLRILWRFCCVFFLITLAWNVVPVLLSRQIDLGIFGPPKWIDVAAWLFFEWIFVGIAEEIMFRGVIQTNLASTWTGVWRVAGVEIPSAGVVTTVLFCLAHINPLHPHVNWPQQLFALGLGIYYSIVRHRTGSLLNPILAHNAADGMILTAIYLLYFHLH